MSRAMLSAIMLIVTIGSGCSSPPPLKTVAAVDLPRFMGDWYVIASIPTFLEVDAYNPVESYRLDVDGSVATTFTFNAGGLDGEKKTYRPRGFVRDRQSNAVWGMQFIWPIKADYRIVYLDEQYQYTIIGRNQRDYVWIMARDPVVDEPTYADLMGRVESFGYALEQVVRASHKVDQKDKL